MSWKGYVQQPFSEATWFQLIDVLLKAESAVCPSMHLLLS